MKGKAPQIPIIPTQNKRIYVEVTFPPETETEIYYDIRLSNELVGRLLYIDSIYTRISN